MNRGKFPCPHCPRVCQTARGLAQHTKRVAKCKKAQREALNCAWNDDQPANLDGLRRSKRQKREHTGAISEDALETESQEVVPDPADLEQDNGSVSDNNNYVHDNDGYDTDLDEEGSRSGNSTNMDPEPSRQKLDEFRAYCNDLKGMPSFPKETKSSIKLMDVLRRKKAPLNAFSEVLEWHLKESGTIHEHETLNDTQKYHHRETLLKKLYPRYKMLEMMPKIKRIKLPSSKASVEIPYRDAHECVVSLLTDPRRKDTDFLFHGDNPWGSPPEKITHLSELNTGEAYLKSYEKRVTKKNQILVQVPFYIDGATTGQFVDLPVTPLKISLGIFTREAREKEWAWRTIGWLPQVRKAKSRGKSIFKDSNHLESYDVVVIDGEGDTESETEDDDDDDWDMEDRTRQDKERAREDTHWDEKDEDTDVKAQDFHTIIATILEASGFLELQRTGMIWDLVYKGFCYKDSEMIFEVVFVKCDTEEGDLNCGKYLSRTKNVKHGCRYCHCTTDELDDPLAKHKPKTQGDIKKLVDRQDLDGLKEISQQYINNAWYKVRFHAANNHGIHGACPSEKLHAILLGIFKYLRGTWFEYIGEESKLADDINGLAKWYGKFLTHQSEKDFPTTNFTKGIKQGRLMATQCR